MKVDFSIDVREFNDCLSQYVSMTSKDSVDAVNMKTRDLAIRAGMLTETASKDEIKSLRNKSWWWSYVRKRSVRRGEKLNKTEMKKLSDKIINARIRSTAFIQSGWWAAAKVMSAAIGKNFTRRTRGKRPTGDAEPARLKTGSDIEATIMNTAGNTKSKSSGQALYNQEPALSKAMDYIKNDMISYMEKKMSQRANQFSAR